MARSKVIGPKRDFSGWQREAAKTELDRQETLEAAFLAKVTASAREEQAKANQLMKDGLYAIDYTVPKDSPAYGALTPVVPGLNGCISVADVVAENTKLKAAVQLKEQFIQHLLDAVDDLEWRLNEAGVKLSPEEDKPKAEAK